LISGALSSGAVNSSWIWNLLTAVFTVTSPFLPLAHPLYRAFNWPLLYFRPLTYGK
jgi:hypothetical protein